MPRLTTPYYLHGSSKKRFHTNQAEKAGMAAAGAGAMAAGLHHPKYRGMAIGVAAAKGYHIQPHHAKAFGSALGIAAGATAGYAGYHAGRAAHYEHLHRTNPSGQYVKKNKKARKGKK